MKSFLRAAALGALCALATSLPTNAFAREAQRIEHQSKARPKQSFRPLTREQGLELLRAMSGPSNSEMVAMLNASLGAGTKTTVFLAAFTAMPANDGTGGTEVSGSGYARISITDNATNFPTATSANPSVKSLATSESFPAATADWMSGANVVGFGLYSASTSGTMYYSAYALSGPVLVTADPATDLFTSGLVHGLTTNDAVRFVMGPSGTFPSPIVSTTTYYVIATGLTTTVFAIALTQGGSAINMTTAPVGSFIRVYKSYVGPVINGTTLTIAANQLTIQLQAA